MMPLLWENGLKIYKLKEKLECLEMEVKLYNEFKLFILNFFKYIYIGAIFSRNMGLA